MTKEELNKLDLKQLNGKEVEYIIWKTKIQSKELDKLHEENDMLKNENIKLKKQNMIFKNFITKVNEEITNIF
jgi:cell division protein FtsB